MTSMATTAGAPAQRKGGSSQAAAPVQVFTRSAKEHTQLAPFDQSVQLNASTQGPFSIEVPATGYVRSVLLLVEATGGAGAGVTAAADGPFNVLQNLTLKDVNGSPIIEPISGWELAQINKWGGYSFAPDPSASGAFSAVAAGTGNFKFLLRVPVEINAREARGALANMNAAQPYRIEYQVAPLASVYGVAPTTAPSVRVRAVLEAWTDPGFPPPGHGMQQFWTKQVYNVLPGSNTIKLARVGNAIRNLILIHRTAAGVRSNNVMFDPLTFAWDNRQLNVAPRDLRRHYATERYGFAPAALDTGVDTLEFTHDFDGHPGGEIFDLWVPTSQASRLELQGTAAEAGSLIVLTNDVVIPAAATATA